MSVLDKLVGNRSFCVTALRQCGGRGREFCARACQPRFLSHKVINTGQQWTDSVDTYNWEIVDTNNMDCIPSGENSQEIIENIFWTVLWLTIVKISASLQDWKKSKFSYRDILLWLGLVLRIFLGTHLKNGNVFRVRCETSWTAVKLTLARLSFVCCCAARQPSQGSTVGKYSANPLEKSQIRDSLNKFCHLL